MTAAGDSLNNGVHPIPVVNSGVIALHHFQPSPTNSTLQHIDVLCPMKQNRWQIITAALKRVHYAPYCQRFSL